MTITTPASGTVAPPVETVNCSIDGIEITVPKGTLIIRAAEQIGIEIPRFCDHPLLGPVAACRACLVDIEGQFKPQPACAATCGDNMVIHTQLTSDVADQAQRGVMEFLLVNHPLDCPVCDKGGECPLQNQAMTHGHGESRYHGNKRTFPKPIPISTQILLDRERCVSCTRCTRFAEEIAGDPFIELLERGSSQQIGIAQDQPFDSYFSGNTVQICPVGALTSTDYRFRARPFDLVSTPTACEHCASGCELRADHRRDKVVRRLAWDDVAVNEEWNCDKGRFAFGYQDTDRLTTPLIRDGADLRPASWPEAIGFVAGKLAAARGKTAVFTGGRVTREDAYAYAKFARVALASDDIDFRSRPTSLEEQEFLSAVVAGSGLGVTYADIETAPVVLLVGIEPEEESPIIFLRLRKGSRAGTASVAAISTWASPGFSKAGGAVLAAAPGAEAVVLSALAAQSATLSEAGQKVAGLLTEPGAVILVGERLAQSPGAISAARALSAATGAALAWVPRRAGERGALDAGALAGLLPGGRPLTDAAARAEVAVAWGIGADDLPTERGLNLAQAVAALTTPPDTPADGEEADEPRLSALVVGGLEISDVADPSGLRHALQEADFVLSLETRLSGVAVYADAVLPVAVDSERAGSYVDWEGRIRPFQKALKEIFTMTDGRILAMIADEMDSPIGYGDPASLRRELDQLGTHQGIRNAPPAFTAPEPAVAVAGTAVLSTWRHLLDLGLLQAGEQYLAGTRRVPVARLSPTTAAGIGASDYALVTVATDNGSITLPLVVTDMPDGVVWVPTNSPGSVVNESLGVTAGSVVAISVSAEQSSGGQ